MRRRRDWAYVFLFLPVVLASYENPLQGYDAKPIRAMQPQIVAPILPPRAPIARGYQPPPQPALFEPPRSYYTVQHHQGRGHGHMPSISNPPPRPSTNWAPSRPLDGRANKNRLLEEERQWMMRNPPPRFNPDDFFMAVPAEMTKKVPPAPPRLPLREPHPPHRLVFTPQASPGPPATAPAAASRVPPRKVEPPPFRQKQQEISRLIQQEVSAASVDLSSSLEENPPDVVNNIIVHIFLNSKGKPPAHAVTKIGPVHGAFGIGTAHGGPGTHQNPIVITKDFDRDKLKFVDEETANQMMEEGPANIVEVKAMVSSPDRKIENTLNKAVNNELDRAIPVVLNRFRGDTNGMDGELRKELEQALVEEIAKNLGETIDSMSEDEEKEIVEGLKEAIEQGFNEATTTTTTRTPVTTRRITVVSMATVTPATERIRTRTTTTRPPTTVPTTVPTTTTARTTTPAATRATVTQPTTTTRLRATVTQPTATAIPRTAVTTQRAPPAEPSTVSLAFPTFRITKEPVTTQGIRTTATVRQQTVTTRRVPTTTEETTTTRRRTTARITTTTREKTMETEKWTRPTEYWRETTSQPTPPPRTWRVSTETRPITQPTATESTTRRITAAVTTRKTTTEPKTTITPPETTKTTEKSTTSYSVPHRQPTEVPPAKIPTDFNEDNTVEIRPPVDATTERPPTSKTASIPQGTWTHGPSTSGPSTFTVTSSEENFSIVTSRPIKVVTLENSAEETEVVTIAAGTVTATWAPKPTVQPSTSSETISTATPASAPTTVGGTMRPGIIHEIGKEEEESETEEFHGVTKAGAHNFGENEMMKQGEAMEPEGDYESGEETGEGPIPAATFAPRPGTTSSESPATIKEATEGPETTRSTLEETTATVTRGEAPTEVTVLGPKTISTAISPAEGSEATQNAVPGPEETPTTVIPKETSPETTKITVTPPEAISTTASSEAKSTEGPETKVSIKVTVELPEEKVTTAKEEEMTPGTAIDPEATRFTKVWSGSTATPRPAPKTPAVTDTVTIALPTSKMAEKTASEHAVTPAEPFVTHGVFEPGTDFTEHPSTPPWEAVPSETDEPSPSGVCPTPNDPSSRSRSDVLFLLDSSNKFTEDKFMHAITLILNTVDKLKNIGPEGIQVSLVQFNSDPYLEFSLRKHNCKHFLKDDIGDTEYMTGGSMLGKALEKVMKFAFTKKRGDRPDAPNILIILTDGQSEDRVQLPVQVSKDHNVTVFVVGTLEANPEYLKNLSGKPENIFQLSGSANAPLAEQLADRITKSGVTVDEAEAEEGYDDAGDDDVNISPAHRRPVDGNDLADDSISPSTSSQTKIVHLECTGEGFKIKFTLPSKFEGHAVVKGKEKEQQCQMEIKPSSEAGNRTLDFFVPADETCGVTVTKSEDPPGRNSSVIIHLVHAPALRTEIDRAFLLQCHVGTKTKEEEVSTRLDVVKSEVIIAETISLSTLPPSCTYSIRKERPDGPIISRATVGQAVYHRWDCDGDEKANNVFGIKVHSCFASDDVEQKYPIVDGQGCSSDLALLTNIAYDDDRLSAYALSHVFGVLEHDSLKFVCKLSLCTRDGDGCEGVTPPRCTDNHTDILVWKPVISPTDPALTSALSTKVDIGEEPTYTKIVSALIDTKIFLAISGLMLFAAATLLVVHKLRQQQYAASTPSMSSRSRASSHFESSSSGEGSQISGPAPDPRLAEFLKTFDRSRYV